jgi:hydrogenase nickel incorporation protein HypA/HybF
VIVLDSLEKEVDNTGRFGWEKIVKMGGRGTKNFYLPPYTYYSIMKVVTNMHEFSVTESILTLALEKAGEAGAGKITRINLVIGELSGIVDDCVRFYFDHISKDTIAEGAELAIEMRPTRLRCDKCDAVFTPEDHSWSCPTCREPALEIVAGRECYMESIEVE